MRDLRVNLIAGVNPTLTRPGGIRSYVLSLAEQLAMRGTDVTLIGTGRAASDSPYQFIPATRKPFASSFEFLRGLRRLVSRGGVPRGVLHTQRPDDLVPFGDHVGGNRRIVTMHGDPLPGIRSRHGRLVALAYGRLERRGIRSAHRVLFLDRASRASVGIRYPDAMKKFGETSVGIDLSLFQPQNPDQARLRWGLQDGPYVLFAGRFEPEKNLGLLTRALRLCATQPSLVLAGIGPEEEPTVNQLRSTPTISLGVVPHKDMPGLYAAVDATALASTRESMPTACLESLACGTPVVATRTGRLPDIIIPGENGLLADFNPVSFAHMIDNAVRNRADMAQKCIASAARFGWERVLPSLVAEYEAES
jgi:glycosyltransferase involved in cell wall biosynthesis